MNDNITDVVYDYCLIGGGIAGQYLYSKLKKYNTLFISSAHDSYVNDNPDSSYDLNHNLGYTDTWKEKATGLVSYPDFSKDIFPIDTNICATLLDEIKKELDISSMKDHYSDQVVTYNDTVAKILHLTKYRYFDSSYDFRNIKPKYKRKEYDDYWFQRKNSWRHLAATPVEGYAEYFNMRKKEVLGLVIRDQHNTQHIVRAKKYIVACHTPGSLQLIARTLLQNAPTSAMLPYIGKGFSDHVQLSFGLCIKDLKMRRDLPPAMIYADSICGEVPYRIELHNGPPLDHHTNYSQERYPGFSMQKESEHFIRMTAVVEMPSHWDTKIEFSQSKDAAVPVHFRISDTFDTFLQRVKPEILTHIKKKYLNSDQVTLLNDQNWYFSAHIGGGLSDSLILNKDLSLSFAPDISVASLAVMSSLGLYNPTIMLLVFSKYIINCLLNT